MADITVRERLDTAECRALRALFDAVVASGRSHPLGEQKRIALSEQAPGFLAVLARAPGSDRLEAYGQLHHAKRHWGFEYVVSPDAADREAALGAEIVAAGLDAVARRGGGTVQLWALRAGGAEARVAAATGMAAGRELLELRRALPAPDLASEARAPVRAFRVDLDEADLVEVNRAAFADHPEQGAWGIADVRAREREAWFDPGGLLVSESDGRLSGFCWTKVHGDVEPPIGEIYVIGVSPAHQGRRLGRALVCSGIDHLAGLGLSAVMLYVDADNERARRLYASVGFELARTERAFTTEVAPR